MISTIVHIIVGIVGVVLFLLITPLFDRQVFRLMDKALDRFFKWVLKTTEEKERKSSKKWAAK
jgi:uncharacterized membrane protein YbaN (DUF454 family)